MKHFAKYAVSLAVLAAAFPLFTGCGAGSSRSIMDEGAELFAEGKEEENYSLKNSGALLEELIDKYSGSYQLPSGAQMTDDEYDEAKAETEGIPDDRPGDDGSSQTEETPAGIAEVSSREELVRLFHNAYDQTAESLEFRLAGNFFIDFNTELQSIYTELQREDPIDASAVSQWWWGNQGNEYIIEIDYAFDRDELIAMKEETPKLVKEAAAQIDVTGLNDYEIVCAVNDYLCDTIYYPESEPYEPVTHMAYGAFENGCAVCEGYACAAKLLLNELGILCDIEVGTCTTGGGHAWNLVQLDGNWYQMDVTWNDGSPDRADYLLVTDDYMKKSRTWDESLYPATPSTAYVP